jgi:uncharacterized protein YxeA
MLTSIIFLLGSLIMLLPIGTSLNIFSNAMAEEMNPYLNNEDSLEKYAKFYNDDSFREDYYNYHKKHHQLESQQLQIENEVQQSSNQKQEQGQQNLLTESLPQQSISQQQRTSSISQEQMHQQQIVKLKQLLEAVR